MIPNSFPQLGQVLLVEAATRDGSTRPLTAQVVGVDDERMLIELTFGATPPPDGTSVTVSHFATDAMYKVIGTSRRIGSDLVLLSNCVAEPTVQRRRWLRSTTCLPVTLIPPEDSDVIGVYGDTIDIGIGGARVKTADFTSPGPDPLVSLTLLDGEPLFVASHVVSSKATGKRWEYGLAFCDLDASKTRRLGRLVRSGRVALPA